jgi:hypothetical protein
MTVISIFGGLLKREIIKRAYGICGQSTAEFELEPEEYVKGLQALNDQMAIIGATNYNFPQSGDGNPEDESGLDNEDILGAAAYVAELIGPQIGKAAALSRTYQRAMSILLTKYQTIPTMSLRRTTPRGSGNKYWSGPYPYYGNDVTPD